MQQEYKRLVRSSIANRSFLAYLPTILTYLLGYDAIIVEVLLLNSYANGLQYTAHRCHIPHALLDSAHHHEAVQSLLQLGTHGDNTWTQLEYHASFGSKNSAFVDIYETR